MLGCLRMRSRNETETHIAETKARIANQAVRIRAFEASGRKEEARVARVLLRAMTDKLDALQIRLNAILAAERTGISD